MKAITKILLLVSILALVVACVAGCQPQEEPAHTHTLIHNKAKAPTCVNNGILEHWYCPACNGRFADAEATKEVTFADLEIEETGHTGGTATCTEQAVCTTCGKAYGETLTHTGGTATCTEQAICELCNEPYGETLTHTGGTATCTEQAICELCNEPYGETLDHVDANLDITCDFEGCTKRILPAADSKVSLFTANHMIIVSLNNNYYVEGVVTEITDAKNGIFIITDEAGDTLLVRLPKDADGNSYSAWTTKVVVGDTIQVYGKPTKNTGSPAAVKAKVEGGVLTVLKHEHNFSEATCTKESVCACLTVNAPALGHIDEDSNNLCDRCTWNMKLVSTTIAISTNVTKTYGVLDEAKTSWTWGNENFDVVIAKGTSTYTLYTSAKDYMQLKKLNTLTVVNKKNATISTITIGTTNATQLTNLKNALAGVTYTADENALTVTIEWNSAENFTFENKGTTTAYISSVEIVYEKASA